MPFDAAVQDSIRQIDGAANDLAAGRTKDVPPRMTLLIGDLAAIHDSVAVIVRTSKAVFDTCSDAIVLRQRRIAEAEETSRSFDRAASNISAEMAGISAQRDAIGRQMSELERELASKSAAYDRQVRELADLRREFAQANIFGRAWLATRETVKIVVQKSALLSFENTQRSFAEIRERYAGLEQRYRNATTELALARKRTDDAAEERKIAGEAFDRAQRERSEIAGVIDFVAESRRFWDTASGVLAIRTEDQPAEVARLATRLNEAPSPSARALARTGREIRTLRDSLIAFAEETRSKDDFVAVATKRSAICQTK